MSQGLSRGRVGGTVQARELAETAGSPCCLKMAPTPRVDYNRRLVEWLEKPVPARG